MARIAGVDLPAKKRAEIGLTYIYGIGRTRALSLLHRANVDPGKKIADLAEDEINRVRTLIENEGSVVSRAELLEHVWGMTSSPSTRTVDNFIMRLRKCFEVDPAQPRHFLSVRGAGYRFVAKGDGAA